MTDLRTLLTAARVHRTFPALASMLFAAAFAGRVTAELAYLGGATVLLYMAFAIHNARMDGDYELPAYHSAVMAGLLAATVGFAATHRIVGLSVAAWVVLGFIYNTIARRVFLGDVTLLALTHHALPAFSAGLLVALPVRTAAGIAAFLYVVSWFFIHVKNLKDIEQDAANGYDTIVTRDAEKGIWVTQRSLLISFLLMGTVPLVFEVSVIYAGATLVLGALVSIILLRIEVGRHEEALDLIRMLAVTFLLGVSLSLTPLVTIIVPLGVLWLLYSPSLRAGGTFHDGPFSPLANALRHPVGHIGGMARG